MHLPSIVTAHSTAPQACVCMAKHSKVTVAAQAGSATRVTTPASTPGLRSKPDATCTCRLPRLARETLLTSGAEFGDVTSPAQFERAELGGAYQRATRLHHDESGKPSIVHLDSIHALEVTSRVNAHRLEASTGSAHSPGGHSVNQAPTGGAPGI